MYTNTSQLAGMSQDDVLKFLRDYYGGEGAAPLSPDEEGLRPYMSSTPREVWNGDLGGWVIEAGLDKPMEGATQVRPITSSFDPNAEGGQYGHYEGIYDANGKLLDTQFRQDERHSGWLGENLETIGPLVVGGMMLAGAGGFLPNLSGGEMGWTFGGQGAGTGAIQGGGSEALIGGTAGDSLGAEALTSGITDASLGELGINTALPAGVEGGVSAITDAALGELGINTALPMGAPGGVYGASPWINPLLAEGAAGAAAGAGAEILKDTAGLDKLIGKSLAKDALTTAGTAGAAKSLWDTGKDLVNTVKPVASVGKSLWNAVTGGGGNTSGGTSGFGGLGGLGGILGLALLISQLRKDQNAQPAGATPVIPHMRSRVQQNPFTVDASGKKKAPLSYFGEPQYYAAGGGIGGLAAGGQASRPIRGDGDGVSDSIPAQINGSEPAALADGEFVIDARTVAELGNGSTDAGTRKLEAMVARVHEARAKARRGEDSGAARHMPA